jgi:hypothetical protein
MRSDFGARGPGRVAGASRVSLTQPLEPEALQLQEPEALKLQEPEPEPLELLELLLDELWSSQASHVQAPRSCTLSEVLSFQPGHGSEQLGTPWLPVSTKAALAHARAPVSQYQ